MLSDATRTHLNRMVELGEPLTIERLADFFFQALDRWEDYLGDVPPNFAPVLGWYEPLFSVQIPEEVDEILKNCPLERRHEVAKAFVAWELKPETQGKANAYEPLIWFFHHGGTLTRPENGILDIYDSNNEKFGILTSSSRRKRSLNA